MPEGHTLHRLAGELRDRFAGRVVRASSPQGRFADATALLDGTRLLDAQAWGKQLFVEFEGDRFVQIHLGLIGSFRFGEGEPPPPVGQVRLRLAVAASRASYGDLRGATTCALVTDGAAPGRPRPARPRPAALRRRLDEGLGPGQPEPQARRRAADGPAGAGRRRQRLPGGAAVPAPGAPAAPGQHAAPRPVRGDVGRPGRADARGRAVRPDRHRPRRSTPRTRWVDRPAWTTTGERSTSTGGTASPATCAAPACAPQVLEGRNLFWCPRCQPTFRSRART